MGALLAGTMLLAACGEADAGIPTLTWYTNPDNGGQAELAEKCTQLADGAYEITTSVLPNSATAQREQLIRRLAANDASIDLMSLDPPYTPEFAEAGFLLDIPDEMDAEFTDGIVEPAVEHAMWEEELVAAPFWANTQLLWYRASVAEEAGILEDLEFGNVTWEAVIDAAEQTGTTIGVQANRYEGYTVWINALIEGAGGSIILNPGAGVPELDFGLDEPPAVAGSAVIADLAESGVAGPAVSTAGEEEARALFQAEDGGFMVNWPYVWAAANGEVDSGVLDPAVVEDIRWSLYPRTVEDEQSAPPLGGINLAMGAFTNHPEAVLDAALCITSPESQVEYMLFSGNPAAHVEAYDAAAVQEQFPMADAIRQSLQQAAPRPKTPFYNEVSASLQRTYHPPSSVVPEVTPEVAGELIQAVLQKEALL